MQTQPVLPTGTLTFLFTDIEGSTQRWERNPQEMREILARHDGVVREVLERHGGTIFKTVGDAFCSAFGDPDDAIQAAADIQRSVADVRVRIAIHTGTAQLRDGDYFGPTLNRVARLLAHVEGGQVVVSDATERLVRDELPDDFGLSDLGERELKDVARPVRVFQLTFPGMLPLYGQTAARTFVPNNLPEELSSFVGRKAELTRLKQLLQSKRELTIVGPGGVGKTRLALRLAANELETFAGGVWFIELADIVGADIATSVARAMNVAVAGRDPLQAVISNLGSRPVLLVLDNSERIIDEVGWFACDVLRANASVHILVTSRERMRIEGEQTFLLQPLALPGGETSLEVLRRIDAVKLLVERAQAARDDFKLTDRNRADVISICARLDGIPLALELAAARLRSLSPAQVVARLDEQFALLTGGRERLDHHRTLRATIDWSYRLLDDRSRLLFARLGIMRGPFTLEAVEAICADEQIGRYDVFDVLATLVEKSFLSQVDSPDIPQFRMLNTIQAYATERLAENGEYDSLAPRHFAYHRDLVKRANDVSVTDQVTGFNLIEDARADIRAALQWGRQHCVGEVSEFALAMARFWIIRGYMCEGSGELETIAKLECIDASERATLLVRASGMRNAVGEHEVAERDAEEAVRICEGVAGQDGLADAIAALGGVYANAGQYERAREFYLRALELHERDNDRPSIVQLLTNLGIVLTSLERFDEAQAALTRAIPLALELNDARNLAWLYGALGNVAHQAGRFAQARSHYEQCLAVCRSIGYKTGTATVLNHLADVVHREGNDRDAQRFLEESLALAWEHNLSLQLVDALEEIARMAATRGDDVAAAQLFGAVDTLRRRMAFPFTPTEQTVRAEVMRPVRERHGDAWFDAQSAAGSEQSIPALVHLAQTALRRRGAAAPRR